MIYQKKNYFVNFGPQEFEKISFFMYFPVFSIFLIFDRYDFS
jgi:hypothetical protein